MKTFDIDGTLLDYAAAPGSEPLLNHALIATLNPGDRVALVTNQGGLPFGLMGSSKFPRPSDFLRRLRFLASALAEHGIIVVKIVVCTYHPKADPIRCAEAAEDIEDALIFAAENGDLRCYYTEEWRKPNPAMLIEAGATVYYGDSEEDSQAAAAAGIPFVKVERFTSGGGGQPINLIECVHCGRKDKVIINDRERWCPECGKKRVYYVAVDEMRPPFNSQLWLAHEPLQEYPDEAEMVQAFIEDLYPDKVDIAFGSARAWVVDRLDDEAPARCYEVRVDYVPTWFAYEIDQGST